MNNEDVLGELEKETGAQVQGYLKDGRWYITATKVFAYMPPIEPRLYMKPFEVPNISTADAKRYTVTATGDVDYYMMKHRFLVVARNLKDQLEAAFRKAVDADNPRRWPHRFQPFDGDNPLVGSDPWSHKGYSKLMDSFSVFERRNLMFGNPTDENDLKRHYPDSGIVKMRFSNHVKPGEAFVIGDEWTPSFKRTDFSTYKMSMRLTNKAFGEYAVGTDAAYWPDKKPVNQELEAWNKSWRVTGRYEWEWMNKVGDWLNRLFAKVNAKKNLSNPTIIEPSIGSEDK